MSEDIERLPTGVRPETDLSEGLARPDATEDLPVRAPDSDGGVLLLHPDDGLPWVLP